MISPGKPLSDTEERALSLDGLATRHGSMISPSPFPPFLNERAAMARQRVPEWAILRGISAGWVWTGMGRAEPWDLIAQKHPAISPIARQRWKPLVRVQPAETVASIRGLRLLSAVETAKDLLTARGDDEVAAAQLFQLSDRSTLRSIARGLGPLTATSRVSLRARVFLVEKWWDTHPEVTR